MARGAAHSKGASDCYCDMSVGRSETPAHQLKSDGDNPASSARPRVDSRESFMDGPFGGKKPE